jgi:hypothetical protein
MLPEREEPIVEENVDYEEELDRIESLLDINNSDIDLSTIAKPIVPNEATEVAAPVVPEEKVVELVETKTQSLAQTVKALQKEVKSLANANQCDQCNRHNQQKQQKPLLPIK